MKLYYFPPKDKQIEIPKPNCQERKELVEFALSFNGYQYVNSGVTGLSELYRQVKEKLRDGDLSAVTMEELRCCLFWKQRANRWNDIEDIHEYQYWVDLIRRKA
jgi:hypothetical protein